MPNLIKLQIKDIIINIKNFFHRENLLSAPIIPLEKVKERVAAATGLNARTISRIMKEKNSQQIKKMRSDKIVMDSFDIGVLRRKIHEFYNIKKELPTVKKIHAELREEIGFKGCREILRRQIKEIGFAYKKTKSNRKALMEKNEITSLRAHYLQSIKHNEETEKLPVVYLDETYIHAGHTTGGCWQHDDDEMDGVLQPISKGQRFIIVHAGSEEGFVDNACLIFKSQTKSGDYHDDMNHSNFKKWVSEKLAPNLRKPSLIVMDNASYHNAVVSRPPNTNSRKAEIQEWLARNNIVYSEEYTKSQLLEIVKRNKPEPVYAVDAILKGLGHKILRLPPYHCDLNPIEMVWAAMKQKVANANIGHAPNEIPQLVENAFNEITANEWSKYCSHVKKIEKAYREKDGYLDEPFIITVSSDSEESDEDSDSEDEDQNIYSFTLGPFDKIHAEHNYSIPI